MQHKNVQRHNQIHTSDKVTSFNAWVVHLVIQAGFNTIVALDHLVGQRIILWNHPWTGPGTGHTADAFFLINDDDPVFSLGNGIDRTNGGTKRILALVAASK